MDDLIRRGPQFDVNFQQHAQQPVLFLNAIQASHQFLIPERGTSCLQTRRILHPVFARSKFSSWT